MQRRLQAEIRQSKPVPSLEEEVCVEIQRTAQVVVRWLAEALKASGLTPTQFNVLRILRGAGSDGLPSGEIGARMIADDPDLTRLLDRLEARELVKKSRGTSDRRVVRVHITDQGLGLVKQASSVVQLKIRSELAALGEKKLQSLADLLELARARIDRPGCSATSSSKIASKNERRPQWKPEKM